MDKDVECSLSLLIMREGHVRGDAEPGHTNKSVAKQLGASEGDPSLRLRMTE